MGKVCTFLILVAFLFIGRPCFSYDPGNSQEFTIIWKNPASISTSMGVTKRTLKCEFGIHDEEFSYLPVYPVRIEGKDISEVKVAVGKSIAVSEDEEALMDFKKFQTVPLTRLKSVLINGKRGTQIWVLPFFTDSISGEIKKVLSFTLQYTNAQDSAPSESIYRRGEIFESVLSSGEWYKLGVTEDGVYKIDYTFLLNLGIDPGAVNPKTIRLFGNGCYMLPQQNDLNVRDDLIENRIYVSGEEDGQFDQDDYIIFYGLSPHKLKLQKGNSGFYLDYVNNIYSDTSYYFLTISGSQGLRIYENADLGDSFPLIHTFDHLMKYENDMLNILSSGREWYGEKYDLKTSYDYEFEAAGLSSNEEIKIVSAVMASSYNPSYFEIEMNGFILGQQPMDVIPDTKYGIRGTVRTDTFTINTSILPDNTNPLKLTLEYVKGSSNELSAGYLDYLNIWCKRDLAIYDDQTIFQSVESTQNANSTFSIIDDGSDIDIWEVTDPFAPSVQNFSRQDGTVLFGTETSELKKFILFSEDNLLIPSSGIKLENQNLHGSETKEFIIITYPGFMLAANRLKMHREQRGISTEVVTTSQIFNEFSSGAQDVSSIRNFIKYRYDNSGEANTLKYVLLLGRGSYDYKDRIANNTNYVPIYESRNSLHPIYSYSSDDYYAFLDDGEGEWEENFLGDHMMDISVGRLPVITSFEASDVVNKIIIYESDTRGYGPWRNDICFVADDGDGVDGIRHSNDAEKLSVMVDTSYSNFNIGKIYVDAFPQIILPDKQESPEARKAVDDAIKSGVLIMNFTGHGNEFQWTSEKILDNLMVTRWENLYQLPFFVTATCEYGRHDDPKLRSGAEYAMINKRGGVIGLVTTARPVFASTNYILNRVFYSQVFEKVDGTYQTVGEIFRNTKNGSLNGAVNRNFSLLGDPSMKLAYPDRNVTIETINEMPVDPLADTLKALKKVTVTGKILDFDQNHLSSYNGILTAKVYDKSQRKETLGTQDPVMQYNIRESLIFNGDVSIRQGDFDFQFIVPKNISYQLGDGKISLYAVNDEHDLDAAGSNIQIPVGGSQDITDLDDMPPEIQMFLEDTTFMNGDLTSDHPRLIAFLFDENGINITENGVSRGIVASLDDQQDFILNKFYKANIDDYQSGTLSYQFSELEEGSHSLVLQVWDTYNNMAEGYLEFLVGESHELVIKNLLNYPNPFGDMTTFSFEHNRSGEDLEVIIQIYSREGRLVKVVTGVTINSEFRINDIQWDGRGGSGKKLETGIYIYRVNVRSLVDGAKNEEFKQFEYETDATGEVQNIALDPTVRGMQDGLNFVNIFKALFLSLRSVDFKLI